MKKIVQFLSVSLLACFFAFAAPKTSQACCNCAAKITNVGPTVPLRTIAAGWLQWLNHGTFTCSGNASSLSCVKSAERYNFYFYNYGSTGQVDVYEQSGTYRNTATFAIESDGSVWSWDWDGGANYGYMTMTCQANPNQPGFCNWLYGTCD